MSDQNNEKDASIFDQSFWDELNALGAGDEWSTIASLSKQALTRPMTSVELDYLLRQYAYLELSDALAYQPKPVEPEKVRFIQSKSGWLIHDHGAILRASPGNYSQVPKSSAHGGYGTLVQQYVDTVRDMLAIAKDRWSGAKILGGYRAMQCAAYIIALVSDYPVEGIELTADEMRTYQYVKERVLPIPSQLPELDRMPR